MDRWYLKDSRGAHVGPVAREVAVDLIRAKPGVFLFVSSDAREWKPIARSAPVQAMVHAEPAPDRLVREHDEAKRLLTDLDRLRRLQPHELFNSSRQVAASRPWARWPSKHSMSTRGAACGVLA